MKKEIKLLSLGFVSALIPIALVLTTNIDLRRFEIISPRLASSQDFQEVESGTQHIVFSIEDTGTGLNEIRIYSELNGQTNLLMRNVYGQSSQKVAQIPIPLFEGETVDKQGNARFRIIAVDRSFFQNTLDETITFNLDLQPPNVRVLSSHVSPVPGNFNIVFFEVIEDSLGIVGIKIGELAIQPVAASVFNPSFINNDSQSRLFAAMFAYPPKEFTGDGKVILFAVDRYGNSSEMDLTSPDSLPDHIVRDHVDLQDHFTFRFGKSPTEGKIIRLAMSSAKMRFWKGAFSFEPLNVDLMTSKMSEEYKRRLRYINTARNTLVKIRSTSVSEVTAAGDGLILHADRLGQKGLSVAVDHGLGVTSFYYGLSNIPNRFKVGKSVVRGERIGTVGKIGSSKGFVFEMRINGIPARSKSWFDKGKAQQIINKLIKKALRGLSP